MLRLYCKLLEHERVTDTYAEREEELDTEGIRRNLKNRLEARAEQDEDHQEQLAELSALTSEMGLSFDAQALKALA